MKEISSGHGIYIRKRFPKTTLHLRHLLKYLTNIICLPSPEAPSPVPLWCRPMPLPSGCLLSLHLLAASFVVLSPQPLAASIVVLSPNPLAASLSLIFEVPSPHPMCASVI